jgi:hypothetical protein
MVGMSPSLSKDDISGELVAKATELWGEGRAVAIRSTLDNVAESLWVLGQNLPDLEQEPAFFL